jgi:hypothetical protein
MASLIFGPNHVCDMVLSYLIAALSYTGTQRTAYFVRGSLLVF